MIDHDRLFKELEAQIGQLSSDQLEDLGEAPIDFISVVDLKSWLAAARGGPA